MSQDGMDSAENVVIDEDLDKAAADFEAEVSETFNVDREDIEIERDKRPMPGSANNIAVLTARFPGRAIKNPEEGS